MKIILIGDKSKVPSGQHPKRYNLPQGCEVAALMPGEGDGELEVVVRQKDNILKRISTLHRSYDPLVYVLVDPYGTDGFNIGVGKKKGSPPMFQLPNFTASEFKYGQGSTNF